MSKHKSVAPVVPIELDRPRNLMIDFAALEAIEDKLDQPGIALALDFWGDPKDRLKRTRVALWAGLLHEDPDLTLEQLNQMLRGKEPGVLMQAIMTAWGFSRPEPKEEDEENPPQPEAALPGSDSGASQDSI